MLHFRSQVAELDINQQNCVITNIYPNISLKISIISYHRQFSPHHYVSSSKLEQIIVSCVIFKSWGTSLILFSPVAEACLVSERTYKCNQNWTHISPAIIGYNSIISPRLSVCPSVIYRLCMSDIARVNILELLVIPCAVLF